MWIACDLLPATKQTEDDIKVGLNLNVTVCLSVCTSDDG